MPGGRREGGRAAVTVPRHRVRWREDGPAATAEALLAAAGRRAILVLEIPGGASGPAVPLPVLERLRSAVAVTVADASGTVSGGALELAVSADLLYLREGAALDPGDGVPSPAVVAAFAAAGRRAARRLLLEPGPIGAEEAVRLGVASGVLGPGEPLPLPETVSFAALAAARDLVRAAPGLARPARLALERAAFQLLFAVGDPQEGARAFLERREPRFPSE